MNTRSERLEQSEAVKALGRLVGLDLPEEDLAPLAEGLAEQALLLRQLPGDELMAIVPALSFDPRWHD